LVGVTAFTTDCICCVKEFFFVHFQLRALKVATKHVEDNICRMQVSLVCQ